jgi:hypothetical protein
MSRMTFVREFHAGPIFPHPSQIAVTSQGIASSPFLPLRNGQFPVSPAQT